MRITPLSSCSNIILQSAKAEAKDFILEPPNDFMFILQLPHHYKHHLHWAKKWNIKKLGSSLSFDSHRFLHELLNTNLLLTLWGSNSSVSKTDLILGFMQPNAAQIKICKNNNVI